jgi:hypothetical protein
MLRAPPQLLAAAAATPSRRIPDEDTVYHQIVDAVVLTDTAIYNLAENSVIWLNSARSWASVAR